MKYSHAKTALTILIVCFFAAIVGGIVGNFAGSLATAIITLVIGIAQVVAYGIGGKDNKNFKNAFKIEIASLVISIVAAIISAVGNGANWASITYTILTALCDIIGVLVFYFVCQACGEVTEEEKIKHFAKTTYIWYTVGIVLSCVMSIVNTLVSGNPGLAASGILATLALIAMFVAEILQIILIFRANKHCK